MAKPKASSAKKASADTLPEKEILKSGRLNLGKMKADHEQHSKFDKFKKGTK